MAGFNGPNLVTDGLVLVLDAGNTQSYSGSGNTWTDLVGSYDGTLTNGPTFSSANGGSIVFDGIDDYTDTGWGSGLNPSTVSYSFESWVKSDSPTASRMFLAPTNHGGNSRAYMGTGFSQTSRWTFQVQTGSGITSTAAVTTNWTHVTNVLDSSDNKARMYINGVLNATSTTAYTSYTFNSSFQIGRGGGSSAPGYYWDGQISNVKIYNGKALTAAEVLQNFDAHKGRFGL